MTILVGLILLFGFMLIIYGVSIFVRAMLRIWRPKKSTPENPYIKAHQIKQANDYAYDKYLEWLDKNPDSPIDKVKFMEDQELDNEIDKLINPEKKKR